MAVALFTPPHTSVPSPDPKQAVILLDSHELIDITPLQPAAQGLPASLLGTDRR